MHSILTKIVATAALVISSLLVPVTIGAASAANDSETQIRLLLDNWAKAFHDRDIEKIMSMYDPAGVVAYDIVPPLQYASYAAYKKDYVQFLAQYKGPIEVKFQGLRVVAGNDVAFAYVLEHLSGALVDGTKSDMWIRVTSCFRKVHGRWLDVHDHISVPADLDTGKAMLALQP